MVYKIPVQIKPNQSINKDLIIQSIYLTPLDSGDVWQQWTLNSFKCDPNRTAARDPMSKREVSKPIQYQYNINKSWRLKDMRGRFSCSSNFYFTDYFIELWTSCGGFFSGDGGGGEPSLGG